MLSAIFACVFHAKLSAKIWRIVSSNRSGAGWTCPRASHQFAFSLVEVSISLSLLALMAGSAAWVLTQMNTFAAASRVHTCAEMLGQNEIDEFLSAGPFNPQFLPAQIPAALATVTNGPPIVTSLNGNGTVTVYTDGEPFIDSNSNGNWNTGEPFTDLNGNAVLDPGTLRITGTMTRTVADLALPQTTNGVTNNLNTRRLTVTVNYALKGKPFQVVLSSMRTSDF